MQSPSLDKLPLPPGGKTGWPWTEDTPISEKFAFAGETWPRFSIVTPTLNQGKFIEGTIRSVLLQGYPDLEYIIIDGGSTDETLEIIKKYERWISYWVSEPDRGQSEALNKGFRRVSGEILAYLNSDDIYYPGTLQQAALALHDQPYDLLVGGMDQVMISGDQIMQKNRLSPKHGNPLYSFPIYSNGRTDNFRALQPSMFWTRALWEKTGEMKENLHFMMDREWCLRALANDAAVMLTETPLARYTIHPGSKTHDYQRNFSSEMVGIYLQLSSQKGFRRIPCWLAALEYRLVSSKEKAQDRSIRFQNEQRAFQSAMARLEAKTLRVADQAIKQLARRMFTSEARKQR